MSAEAAVSALVVLGAAAWLVYCAVQADRSLRPDVVQVGCTGPGGGNGRAVCISTLDVGLEGLCACSKQAETPAALPSGASRPMFHTEAQSTSCQRELA